MNYQVSDFVTRIKNASLAKRKKVLMPFSRINKSIGEILVKENFLKELKEEIVEDRKFLSAYIRYEKREPIFNDALIVSKPSLRVYTKAKDVFKLRGIGVSIFSTSKGIMTDKEAKKEGVGGELLFKIW
ncbi:30S ribosomal protein S8 [Candidatus Microgenomates bacterium]|nr:MAG: 30S ribosomal protein S8 [Candidatus Microgenomates bacterium]